MEFLRNLSRPKTGMWFHLVACQWPRTPLTSSGKHSKHWTIRQSLERGHHSKETKKGNVRLKNVLQITTMTLVFMILTVLTFNWLEPANV